jgi:ethanolamine ammonia-lyase small subunit
MESDLTPPEAWTALRRHTTARLALGRSGGSLPTRAVLAFAHDHALARDAVHAPFDAEALAQKLSVVAGPVAILASAAPDRATYLRHPELGRRLSPAAQAALAPRAGGTTELAIIVSDGLSALAAERHAPPVLAALLPRLQAAGFAPPEVVVARHGRVALQDEIGALLGARQTLMLLGERPGLGTPDSLGAYLTYAPRPGRTDAERNCVSNIHGAGLPAEAAAGRIASLLELSRARQASGLALQDRPAPGG